MRKNVEQLTGQLSSVLKQYKNTKDTIQIILAGGLTNFADIFVPMFSEMISAEVPYSIDILKTEPVVGALWLAGLEREKEIYDVED